VQSPSFVQHSPISLHFLLPGQSESTEQSSWSHAAPYLSTAQ
jgi:hypothetical protein